MFNSWKSKIINIELFSVGSHGEFYLNIASYESCILRHLQSLSVYDKEHLYLNFLTKIFQKSSSITCIYKTVIFPQIDRYVYSISQTQSHNLALPSTRTQDGMIISTTSQREQIGHQASSNEILEGAKHQHEPEPMKLQFAQPWNMPHLYGTHITPGKLTN